MELQLVRRDSLPSAPFSVRFSEADDAYLREIAEDNGVSVAAVIREIVKAFRNSESKV